MLNCNDYRNQILARVGEIGKLSPDTVKGYAASSGAGAKTGHLDAKTRELIALLTRSKRQPETGHSIAWVPVEAAHKVSAAAHRLQRPSRWPLEKRAAVVSMAWGRNRAGAGSGQASLSLAVSLRRTTISLSSRLPWTAWCAILLHKF